jgi:hypothetical protein
MSATNAEARVATNLPKRYMNQLCKHFEHKLPVSFAESAGRIEFPSGTCLLTATDDTLLLRAEAKDAESLVPLQDVISRHLVRFAFREKLEIGWQPITE